MTLHFTPQAWTIAISLPALSLCLMVPICLLVLYLLFIERPLP